ncbi:MAG: hypothetical protein KGO52_12025 [Nitrospirota bacterium]|nr:hypothetical protein [Nitrospirota bacterium]
MTKWLPSALILLLACGALGCTSALAVFPTVQSHQIPGDAKVVPLGQAEGTSEHFEVTFGGLVDLLDPNSQQEAVREAIQKKQGDLLTDYVLSFYAVRAAIPGIDLLNFWWVHWKAEGTVAKVELTSSAPPLPPGSVPSKSEREPRQ